MPPSINDPVHEIQQLSEQTLKIRLCVFNQVYNCTLEITGSRGGDLSRITNGTQIPYGQGKIVGYYETPGRVSDHWDWVYLKNLQNNDEYQLYVEWRHATGSTYAAFGYYNPDSSQSNGNPSPFPDGTADACFITSSEGDASYPVYILNLLPPPKNQYVPIRLTQTPPISSSSISRFELYQAAWSSL